MKKTVEEITHVILPILKRHDVKRVGLFGSVVHGRLRTDSDVDILVDIDDRLSLLDFIKLKLEIEDALGRKVDLVEYRTLKPRLRDTILNDQVIVL